MLQRQRLYGKVLKRFKRACSKNNRLRKKETIQLTYKENKSYKKQNVCDIRKKWFSNDDDNEKYHKIRDHCHYTWKYRGASHSICNSRYKTPKEIPVMFHNGYKYDYDFIIKELAKKIERQFECLGENTEKCITF